MVSSVRLEKGDVTASTNAPLATMFLGDVQRV